MYTSDLIFLKVSTRSQLYDFLLQLLKIKLKRKIKLALDSCLILHSRTFTNVCK